MSYKKFLELLFRITGIDNIYYLRSLCWLVVNLDRKYWTGKFSQQYVEVWNVI